MQIINLIFQNLVAFVLILSLIVFIHEFGHYYVAKLCGVKVEQFSIGFGKEIWGFNDKSGTRWKISLLPLGGYVKMFGDADSSSKADHNKLDSLSLADKKVSFYFQNVYKRMAIVLAGPMANFLLSIFLFTIIFFFQGKSSLLPVAQTIVADSPAFHAGLQDGDEVIAIEGNDINSFSDIQRALFIAKIDKILSFEIKRGSKILTYQIKPKVSTTKDIFGNEVKNKIIGISASNENVTHKKLNFFASFEVAFSETYRMSVEILKFLGQLLTGSRSVDDLGGAIKIAQYSGKSVSMGFFFTLWFMAAISINLGVLNLLPIPMLDGGHFFFYLIEAIKGKPLQKKVQEVGFKIGFSILISLMVFTTVNDIRNLF